jgi:hypothetical protein
MKKLIENYNKPTPVRWQRIGDFSLLMIPAIMETIHELPIDPAAQLWSMKVAGLLMVVVKFWTKTKVETNRYEN